jgi:hypothetical protein
MMFHRLLFPFFFQWELFGVSSIFMAAGFMGVQGLLLKGL